jgi:hypothetical protein
MQTFDGNYTVGEPLMLEDYLKYVDDNELPAHLERLLVTQRERLVKLHTLLNQVLT